MRIIAHTDNMDLRKVIARSAYLKGIATDWDLQDNEAVCFTNKALTRFRLIFKVKNTVFLCIPEIDEKTKLSVYLRISEELSSLAALKDTRIELSLLAEKTRVRINRQKQIEIARAAKQPKVQ